MRILFVVPYIPSLVRVRSYNLIKALHAQGHELHLVLLRPPEDQAVPVEPLGAICRAVEVFPLSRLRTLWNAALALPTGFPLQAAYSHHPQAEAFLRESAASGKFDVAHIEHLRGAVLADALSGLPRVWDSVDSITYLFERTRTQAPRWTQRLAAALDLARTRQFESRAPLRYEHTLVTSPVDQRTFEQLASRSLTNRLTVLPNGVDLDYFQPAEAPREPATILFSGKLSYHANTAAALYLHQEIMPLVWERRPNAHLLLVGKDPSPALQILAADPRVTVTSYVPDLRPYFARATLAAAPLRYGAGVQNKVLEALASGLPVVATKAVLGALQAEPGRDLLIGEDAAQLAAQILALIEQPTLRERLAQAGRQYVEANHDWNQAARRLSGIYQSLRNQHKPD